MKNVNQRVADRGAFVISLDFELHWGVRDHRTVEQYRDNLLGVRQAIPAVLELFQKYGIHATWATVGFLFFETIDDLKANLPVELPEYREARLNPYADLSIVGRNEDEDPFHYAPSLIRQILASEGQEIGTHTFSHFYTLAPGPTLESFRADIRSAKSVAGRYGIVLKSIVFPRNQISVQHLQICAEEGLMAYRSTEADPWINAGNGIVDRALRLADSYVSLSGNGCATPCLDEANPVARVSGSRFLRPWNGGLKRLESMRLERILTSMSVASRNNKTFHLWWHPHNFGKHLEENLAVLTQILKHHAKLNRENTWPSLTMAEVAEAILNPEIPHCVA
jgi:Polysaccharide deacetylase